MIGLLSIGFEFQDAHYSFLARVKEKDNITEYHITVMNGQLEKLLYGNHILYAVNGELQVDSPLKTDDQSILKRQISEALSNHIETVKLLNV